MPKIRRLLGAASIEVAARKRLCHRNRKQHSVPKGGVCLVIKDAASGSSKNYCPQCALAILDQAADDLQTLRDQLTGPTPPRVGDPAERAGRRARSFTATTSSQR